MKYEKNTDELRFVVCAYDLTGELIGERFSFMASSEQDVLENEEPLFDYFRRTVEEFEEATE